MYLALLVAFPDQQALDDGHGDVKLLENVRLFLHFTAFDELVQAFFGKHQCHQVLLHGILVGDIMHVLQFLGIKAYEAEIELFHLRNVPLERFKYHIVAGGDVRRTAQALLCAYQYAVDGGVEPRHDALPFLEEHVACDHKHRAVRETFAQMVFVKFESRYGGTADSHLAGNLPYQFLDIPCLVRNPVSEIPLYPMRDGARLDEQFDLPYQP